MYSVEFGGLSNDIQYGEDVGYNYGLKKEETLVIAGINENLDGVNDSISNYMQGGKLVITKAQMEAKQGKKLDGVRYIRIRFRNVKGNAASNADFATMQAEGVKIRVCGTTNVYADYEDNSGLYSEAAFIRPEQLQFYGYTANTSLEQIFSPAKSPAQSANRTGQQCMWKNRTRMVSFRQF